MLQSKSNRIRRKLQTEYERRDDEGNAERQGQKMFHLDLVAALEQAVKYRECGQGNTADQRAEKRAENRADDEDDDSARAARQNSPENADEGQKQNHFRPRHRFKITDDSADQLAGKEADG